MTLHFHPGWVVGVTRGFFSSAFSRRRGGGGGLGTIFWGTWGRFLKSGVPLPQRGFLVLTLWHGHRHEELRGEQRRHQRQAPSASFAFAPHRVPMLSADLGAGTPPFKAGATHDPG